MLIQILTNIFTLYRLLLFVFLLFFSSSCRVYDKDLDNPNDNKANEELGVFPPSVVLFPKEQTKTKNEKCKKIDFLKVAAPETITNGIKHQLETTERPNERSWGPHAT